MLSLLCLPARRALYRCPTPAGSPRASLRLRFVLEIARDDRLAHWIRSCEDRVDGGDAEGPEPFDFERKLDCAKSGTGGRNRPSGFCAAHARRVQETPRLARSGSEQGRRDNL